MTEANLCTEILQAFRWRPPYGRRMSLKIFF